MSNHSQMCVKMGKLVIIRDDYHDIGRLLLHTIIVSSKNWAISIIVTEYITVNRQKRLFTHPYTLYTESILMGTTCRVNLVTPELRVKQALQATVA